MPAAPRGAVLALDASGDPCSACLLAGDAPPRLAVAGSGQRAGTVLHGLAEQVLLEAALVPSGLALIAAVRGPGSFTGIRVGLAAATGLAMAAGLPCAGVETLRAVAQAAEAAQECCVVMEGGQGRLFVGVFGLEDGLATPLEGPLDLDLDAALARLATFSGRKILRGESPREGALLAAGCERFEGVVALGAARIAARLGLEAGPPEALYARAPAIRHD